MDWSVSVRSTVSSDTEPTIIVAFDGGKYIFNAGENTSRAWLQSRVHWRKTKGIWLTSVGTQRASGLMGLMMFLGDAGIPSVDVGGPPGLLHYLASMSASVYRDGIHVNPIEIASSPLTPIPADPAPVYKDENMSLYGIPLYPYVDENAAETSKPICGSTSESWSSGVYKRKRSPSPASSSKRPLTVASTASSLSQPLADNYASSSMSALLEQATTSRFSPASLTGEIAQNWRRVVIGGMFPRGKPQILPMNMKIPFRQRQREQKEMDEQSVLNSRQNSPFKRAADNQKGVQLPPFTYPLDPRTSRATKPVMSYVLVGPRSRGRFDVAKAIALGLPNGPIRGRLTKGETVTFEVKDEDGKTVTRTVRPEDCVGATESAKVLILLDVPDPSYIPSVTAPFTENPFYVKFCSKSPGDAQEQPVHLVVHICGKGVLEDARYQTFMNSFSEQTHHLVASRAHTPDKVTFTSAAYHQLRLNRLDPDMFPLPKFQPEPVSNLTSVGGLPKHTSVLRTGQAIEFRPFRPPVDDPESQEEDRFHPLFASSTEKLLPETLARKFETMQASVKAISDENARPPQPGDDVVVIPLGTSSATPNKLRNVSSTLVEIPGHGNILLDAGEGTWGQLARLYGDDYPSRSTGVWQMLRDLKCIFLSHLHADHHMGVGKILAMRKLLDPPPAQPLYVVGLRQHHYALQSQADLEDLGLNDATNGVILLLSDPLNWRPSPFERYARVRTSLAEAKLAKDSVAEMCAALGLESFTTVDVMHRTVAFGVVIKHRDGWSIVFSGDTLPTNNLVKAGEGATLLIHEGTMGDDEAEKALEKCHSTVGQAIGIGASMKAKNILLTHFSARYPTMPPQRAPDSRGRANSPVVALAFDHARIRIGDMWKLNQYLPALQQNFSEIITSTGEEE